MTDEQIAVRAVKIAARIMQREGLCRYEDATKCRKVLLPSERDCIGCIKRFLIGKEKKELEREEATQNDKRGTNRTTA